MKKKGYWFYGLSGSGKTYATAFLKKKIKKNIIIDGDVVRKLVSKDLGYSIQHRKIQLSRVLGIAKISQMSNFIPIISTAYFDKNTLDKAKKIGIKAIRITRDMRKIIKKHPTYKNKKNVVGFDISIGNLKSIEIKNDSSKNFLKKLIKII